MSRAVERSLMAEAVVLRATIRRQDAAIDQGLAVLERLARTGSCPRQLREDAIETLMLARNERLPV